MDEAIVVIGTSADGLNALRVLLARTQGSAALRNGS